MEDMMKRALTTMTAIFLLLFTGGERGQAQTHYYDNWFFGDEGLGVNFSDEIPLPTEGSSLSCQSGSSRSSYEGISVISDPITGELLFYSDGGTVWNR